MATKGYGLFGRTIAALEVGEVGVIEMDVTFDASPDPRVLVQGLSGASSRAAVRATQDAGAAVLDSVLQQAAVVDDTSQAGKAFDQGARGVTPVDISALGLAPGERVLLKVCTERVSKTDVKFILETYAAQVEVGTLGVNETTWTSVGPVDKTENAFAGKLWSVQLHFPNDERVFGLNEGAGDWSLAADRVNTLHWAHTAWVPAGA